MKIRSFEFGEQNIAQIFKGYKEIKIERRREDRKYVIVYLSMIYIVFNPHELIWFILYGISLDVLLFILGAIILSLGCLHFVFGTV